MLKRDFTQTGSRLLLLLGQCLIIVVCLAYIHYIYSANILPDKRAKETFKETACFLISKRLSAHGKIFTKYRADFLISYRVQGEQYNRWVSGNGLDMAFHDNEAAEEDVLSQYDVGGSYPCFYDPGYPQISLLVVRHNWLSTFPLMVPSVIILITFYFLIKNSYHLFHAATIKQYRPRKPKRRLRLRLRKKTKTSSRTK